MRPGERTFGASWYCARSATTIENLGALEWPKAYRRWFLAIIRLTCPLSKQPRSSVTQLCATSSNTGTSERARSRTFHKAGRAISFGQSCQRFRQDQGATCNIFGRSIFVRPVAVTVTTGDEQHRHGRNLRHKERIVIC